MLTAVALSSSFVAPQISYRSSSKPAAAAVRCIIEPTTALEIGGGIVGAIGIAAFALKRTNSPFPPPEAPTLETPTPAVEVKRASTSAEVKKPRAEISKSFRSKLVIETAPPPGFEWGGTFVFDDATPLAAAAPPPAASPAEPSATSPVTAVAPIAVASEIATPASFAEMQASAAVALMSASDALTYLESEKESLITAGVSSEVVDESMAIVKAAAAAAPANEASASIAEMQASAAVALMSASDALTYLESEKESLITAGVSSEVVDESMAIVQKAIMSGVSGVVTPTGIAAAATALVD